MDYQTVLRTLGGRQRFGYRPGLEPMQQALQRLGNPERRTSGRVLHIAGTNGKGSVAATAAALLGSAGLKVGLYTSPHLCRLAERFVVDGALVEESDLGPRLQRLMDAETELTFFEICTLAAFQLFADRGCDAWVVEVGLGGRLDATNTLANVGCSVITSIGLDHEAILGGDLAAIAREKAGILRPGVPAFLGPLPDSARAAVEEVAAAVGAPLHHVVAPVQGGVERGGGPLSVRLALQGEHQRQNANLALAAVDTLIGPCLPDDKVGVVLGQVRWPGRAEWLRPDLLVDGAHNLDGARALGRFLTELTPEPRVLLFGASADKAVDDMLALLAPLFAHVVMTQASSERALHPGLLKAKVPSAHLAHDLEAALALSKQLAEGGLVVVAGSLFLVGEVRSRVLGLPSDPAWLSDPCAVKS